MALTMEQTPYSPLLTPYSKNKFPTSKTISYFSIQIKLYPHGFELQQK